MQRGKASVQHYESGGRDMLRMLDGGTGRTIFTTTHAANGSEGKADSEMAGHIVEQLRRAYDELLHEPVPDHLRELLERLSDAEDKS